MPIYDYDCGQHITERRGVGVDLQAILCPECGRPAQRVPVYKSQYIVGETVARSVPNGKSA